MRLSKGAFVGHDALAAISEQGAERRSWLRSNSTVAGVPRQGYPVLVDGQPSAE